MNRKLSVTAMGLALAAATGIVKAEVKLYGQIDLSLNARDSDFNVADPIVGSGDDVNGTGDDINMKSNQSAIGVKGSEDLGGGLKAIYQLELSVDVTDGNGVRGTNRNTFLGLAGDWGTALVGRHDTPMKMAFYAAGNERLGDSVIDLNPGSNNPIGVFDEVRSNDVIAYISPNFSGFTFAAAAIPGEESGEKDTPTGLKNDNDGLADNYSFGLMYKGNGLKAGAGYENMAAVFQFTDYRHYTEIHCCSLSFVGHLFDKIGADSVHLAPDLLVFRLW